MELVRTADSDRDRFSDLSYGTPLEPTEAAELARRAVIQGSIDPTVEQMSANATFAGMYLDQKSSGVPVFMFTADLAAREVELSDLVPAVYGYRVEEASTTYAELIDINNRITSSWRELKEAGIDIVRSGIRTDLNVVEVGVHGLTQVGVTHLQAEFGEVVVVVEDEAAQADSCVSTVNCRPMKGGLKIIPPVVTKYCTSGFVVKTTGANPEIQLLTAGHCLHINGGMGVLWSHNGDPFGSAEEETWHVNATRVGDVGLIDLDTAEIPASKNQLHTEGSIVKTVSGWDSAQFVGDQSCRIGATWQLDCGVINAVNVTRDSTVPGVGTMSVLHTNQVSFDSTGGDSGGAMFFYQGSSVIAQGTHVHSGADVPGSFGWFTPISWGRQAFDDLFGFDYQVCTTASCS